MPKGKIFSVSLLWLSLTICLFLELSAYAGDSCPINIPTAPGNVNICIRTPITWNDFVSDDTIARNSSCTVAITDITGRGGPYYWSVSGNGFSLKESKTKTTQNILLSNGTACGTATVKVTDCSGEESATGYVRCTTGKWVLQPYDTPWPYAPSPSGTIIGKYRITGGTALAAGGYSIGCFPTLADCQSFFNEYSDDYDSICSSPPYVLGCTNALGFDDYPNVNFSTGSWNKYWKPCGRIIGVHCTGYTFGFAWMQSRFRVSTWECP